MATLTRLLHCSADDVWEILSDGWLYPLFVVGATRMREVDPDWPAPGAQLHHSVGGWPALLDDTTRVLECDPSERLVLEAHAWPSGKAEVTFTLRPAAGGTEVTLAEDAASGPAVLVPRPVRGPLLRWRNTETMRRLAHLAERRAGDSGASR